MDTITLALLVYTGVLALIGALLGRSRGIGRQAIRTITVLASAVLGIVLANIISGAALDALSVKTPDELIGIIESAGVTIRGTDYELLINSFEPDTLSYVLALPLSLVIMPIIFIILFSLIKLLMIIVHKIISGICGFSCQRNGFLTRLLGAALGAVQGVAVAIIITAPITGACTLVSDAVAEIRAEADEEAGAEGIVAFYDENMAPFTENAVVKAMGTLGGRLVYNQLASVRLGEEKHNMAEEITAAAPEVSIACTKLGGMDFTAPVANNKEGLAELVDAMGNTPYAKELMLKLLDGIAQAHERGAFVLADDELLCEATDAMFEVIGNVDEKSFESDLNAILDAYYILGREGALTAFTGGELEQVRGVLTKTYVPHPLDPETPSDANGGTTVLRKITEILGTNEHTQPIVTALSRISLSVLAANLGSDMATEEIYENVKAGLTDTLSISREGKSEEEYKAQVRASIDSAMKSSDIDFREDEQYILDNMADYVYDNYDQLVKTDENGEPIVTDEQINDIILSYYDAYLAGQEPTAEG